MSVGRVAASISDGKSQQLFERAQRVIPGAVNSPVRAMRSIGRKPIFIERGSGAQITDVDGNVYVDYVCSWGPLIHGHAQPDVLAAIGAAAAQGTTFGAPTEAEIHLAEELCCRMIGIDSVRLVSSGTEAAMSALRLARAFTQRERILKFAGHYHGHVDGLLVDCGSGLATQSLPASAGLTRAATDDTTVIAWNDPQALTDALKGNDFAAVIAEPAPANMGLVLPEPGFLELLRELTRASGSLLILDEVISGFRVAPGGVQEITGVTADLTLLGKVIGGGLPAAAFGGRSDVMARLAPGGDVYQAGTLSGNPLAVAAGRATLELLTDTAYAQLAATTARLADGLRAAAGDRPVQVTSMPGLLTVFFSERPVRDYADAQLCDRAAHAAWVRALLARGVYPPPSQFEAWFPSLAHCDDHITRTVDAAAAAFAEIA